MVGGLKALGRLLNELLVLGSDSIDMVIHVARCLCAATSGNGKCTLYKLHVHVEILLIHNIKCYCLLSHLCTMILMN